MTLGFLIRSSALLSALLYQNAAFSATVELRPDLLPYLYELRSIYEQPKYHEGEQRKIFGGQIDYAKGPQVVYLSGVIEKGDAEKLSQLYNDPAIYEKIVVLNSPGGNFAEGIRIGEVLYGALEGNDSGLSGVFVLSGDQCLSACSIALSMAAIDPYTPGGSFQGRFIEDGARVGFHMGILPDRLADQSVQFKQALNIAYDVVAAFARIVEDELSPARLLAEALKHRDARSFYEFSGDGTALSMGFNPVSRGILAAPIASAVLSTDVALNMCAKLMFSSHMRRSRFIIEHLGYASGRVNITNPRIDITGRVTPFKALIEEFESQSVAAIFEGGETCYLTQVEGGRVLIDVTGIDVPPSCVENPRNKDIDGWCATAPRTSSMLATVGMLADAMHCPSDQLLPDSPWREKSGKSWQRTVAQSVNVRDQPSLKGKKIATVEAGEDIQVNDCKIVDDGQGVWYNITSDATSGWVSARFISISLW